MAGRMKIGSMHVVLLRWGAAVCCLLACAFSAVHAEDLTDPTRPPSSIFVPATGQAARDSRTGLRMVIISKTRRAAIIDGKTVELWGMHGNAKLIEVNEGGVVLQRGHSRQVLALFPGVKITRKDTPGHESAQDELSNGDIDDIQDMQTSPASEMQPSEDISKPTAHKEEK